MQQRRDRKPSVKTRGILPTQEELVRRAAKREESRKRLAKIAASAFPNDRGNYNLPYPRSQMPSRSRGYAMPIAGADAMLGLLLAATTIRRRRRA
jgi:hypothetical protein